jgi:ATP-dependent exoDNAse (exonuclease V) alpha subunit
MKTPMQELIENLTEQLDKVVKEHPIEVSYDTYWRGVKIGLETTIALAESLLNKEKEQIGRAYHEGLIDGMNHSPKDYYNETFNEK